MPLPSLGLPREVEVRGERWLRKREFHVTAAHVGTLVEQVQAADGAGEAEASASVHEALVRASRDFEVGGIRLREELRLVRDGEQRTIVLMVDAPGVAHLHGRLGVELGVALEPPPAHVTIYTGPEARGGIGLHSAADLARLTEELEGPEAERLRAGIGASLFG